MPVLEALGGPPVARPHHARAHRPLRRAAVPARPLPRPARVRARGRPYGDPRRRGAGQPSAGGRCSGRASRRRRCSTPTSRPKSSRTAPRVHGRGPARRAVPDGRERVGRCRRVLVARPELGRRGRSGKRADDCRPNAVARRRGSRQLDRLDALLPPTRDALRGPRAVGHGARQGSRGPAGVPRAAAGPRRRRPPPTGKASRPTRRPTSCARCAWRTRTHAAPRRCRPRRSSRRASGG